MHVSPLMNKILNLIIVKSYLPTLLLNSNSHNNNDLTFPIARRPRSKMSRTPKNMNDIPNDASPTPISANKNVK